MKKILMSVMLAMVVVFSGALGAFAETLSFPINVQANPVNYPQPPQDYSGDTLNRILVIGTCESNSNPTIVYFNFGYDQTAAYCSSYGTGGCDYNYGQIDYSYTGRVYAYQFSGDDFFSWPYYSYSYYPNWGSTFLDCVVYANFPIYDKDGVTLMRAADLPPFHFPLSGSIGSRTVLLDFGDTWTFGECPTGVYKKHAGIDLSATADEAVYAAHAGTVKAIFTGNHAQWADAIIIEDDIQPYTTVYWHVIKYGNLAVNDHVTKGQQIATIADLGGNTHFHFGFRSGSYDSSFSLAGALPEEDCGSSPTYPAFPEKFIDPVQLNYE